MSAARPPLPAAVQATGAVAVLRAGSAGAYAPVCETLAGAGLTALELTLTTPGTIEGLARLREGVPAATFGVGTVTLPQQVRAAVAAGAEFLVTPITRLPVIEAAVELDCPIVVGAFSPTEAFDAWEAGAAAVKLFPAVTLGASYVGQLRGPFPDIAVMPSGGVGIADIASWIAAGAAAVSLGGPLVGDAFSGGDLAALGDRAERTLAAVREARAPLSR